MRLLHSHYSMKKEQGHFFFALKTEQLVQSILCPNESFKHKETFVSWAFDNVGRKTRITPNRIFLSTFVLRGDITPIISFHNTSCKDVPKCTKSEPLNKNESWLPMSLALFLPSISCIINTNWLVSILCDITYKNRNYQILLHFYLHAHSPLRGNTHNETIA